MDLLLILSLITLVSAQVPSTYDPYGVAIVSLLAVAIMLSAILLILLAIYMRRSTHYKLALEVQDP